MKTFLRHLIAFLLTAFITSFVMYAVLGFEPTFDTTSGRVPVIDFLVSLVTAGVVFMVVAGTTFWRGVLEWIVLNLVLIALVFLLSPGFFRSLSG